MKKYINALLDYAVEKNLINEEDRVFCMNRLLEVLEADSPEAELEGCPGNLFSILDVLTSDAVRRGIADDNIVSRDIFDTKLMAALTPFPHEVRSTFKKLYEIAPEAATEWYYRFAQDTNYIRRDRIAKDLKWKYPCKYGELDITVNLSKPEKDPKAIAAAKLTPQTAYPACQLCAENEGYAGRMNHPARGNHRPVPVKIAGADWFFQYSPYVYYNEHCIVFNGQHVPMKIERATFEKLLSFVEQFPHYFVGSNADLPIVGGSILSHDHFQGGNYEFAMAKAPIEENFCFEGYEDVAAGRVAWPMSVIRLSCESRERLVSLADKILLAWRAYSDPDAFVFAETDGEKHNTITPIARMKNGRFELDLVLRNNITTPEHPLGVFHPHAELHHIKKENIGLIEVMGLAVLPSRLKKELEGLKQAIISGRDISGDEDLSKHAAWLDEIKTRRELNEENVEEVLREEVGAVFERVLEDAGVYKRNPEGIDAFMRFVASVR